MPESNDHNHRIVVEGSFSALLQRDPALDEPRHRREIPRHLPRVWKEFRADAQKSRSFHECFYSLGELVVDARNQGIESVKNFAGALLVDGIKTGDLSKISSGPSVASGSVSRG
jgi:hypothetical protein